MYAIIISIKQKLMLIKDTMIEYITDIKTVLWRSETN